MYHYFPTTALVFVPRKRTKAKRGYVCHTSTKPYITFSTLSLKNSTMTPHDAILLLRSAPPPSKIWLLVTIPSSITTGTYFTAHWTSRCTNEAVFATYARFYSFIAFIWCTKRVYVHRIWASFSPPTQYHASSIHHSNGGCYHSLRQFLNTGLQT